MPVRVPVQKTRSLFERRIEETAIELTITFQIAPKNADQCRARRLQQVSAWLDSKTSERSSPGNWRAKQGCEGFARFFHKPFAQYVRIAKGSEAEVINHFIDARDLKLMTDDEFIRGEHTARRAIKAASGVIRYLESTPDPPPPRYLPKAKLEDLTWGQE